MTINRICDEIRAIAEAVELTGYPSTGPYPAMYYKTTLGTTKYKIQLIMHPLLINSRADKFLQASKKSVTKAFKECRSGRRAQSLKRSKYSPAVAQEFILDEEWENLDEYRRIHGVSTHARDFTP